MYTVDSTLKEIRDYPSTCKIVNAIMKEVEADYLQNPHLRLVEGMTLRKLAIYPFSKISIMQFQKMEEALKNS